VAVAFLIAVLALLAITCYNRVKIWNDDEKLWTDVIEKYPYIYEKQGSLLTVKEVGVDIAYENRANYYRDQGEMDKAFADYELLTSLHSKAQGAYNNAANFYGIKAQDAWQKTIRSLQTKCFQKRCNYILKHYA